MQHRQPQNTSPCSSFLIIERADSFALIFDNCRCHVVPTWYLPSCRAELDTVYLLFLMVAWEGLEPPTRGL